MSNIGLDLGSYAFKLVVGRKHGQKFEVQQAIEVQNPVGALFVTDTQQHQKLVATLTQMFKENKVPTNGLRVSLSESLVVTKVVSMPLLSDAELASAIQWQVEQHIPIPLEEMQYEYAVLRRSDKKEANQTMDVLMIGVQKRVVQALADLLLEAGLDAVVMETDTLATLRVLAPLLSPTENSAVVLLGGGSSVASLVSQGQLRGAFSFPIAGLLFTRAIERGVGLDTQRAEEYKRTYGLLANQLEGKVQAALVPVVQSLVTELQKALRFFSDQLPGQNITRVYVAGGSIYLPDLVPFLTSALSREVVPVQLAQLPNLSFAAPIQQDSRFTVAAGLAMKEL